MKMSGDLSKREYSVLMVIIRYTHGFNRKEARLSGSYIHAACSLRATHVPETLRKLHNRGIIQILPKERNTNVVSFDWEQVLSTPPNSGVSTPPNSGVSTPPNSGVSTPPNSGGYPSQNGSKTPPKTGVKPSQFGREESKEENKEENKEEKEAVLEADSLSTDNSDALF
jgi:phage replication O-like protein O